MVSKQLANVVKMLMMMRSDSIKKRVEDARKGFEALAQLVRVKKDVQVQELDVEGIPASWVTVPDSRNEYVVLYLHGGGFIMGSIHMYRDMASRVARAAKARVLLIGYRLAPENKFPAAIEDCFTAYNWLVENQGVDPKNIIVAGDSAGANLTLALLLKIRDSGKKLPVAAVSMSPCTDFACTGESFKKKAEVDPSLTPYDIAFFAYVYLNFQDPTHPLASPLYADLKGLPPLLIQVGTEEMLLDDSIRFAEKAKKAGVKVELDVWEGIFHGFQLAAGLAPEGQQAIDKVGEFMKKFFR